MRHKIKDENMSEQELFAVVGLPHIGPMLGKNLLKHFETVRAVFASSREELMKVKGIGPQIAEDVMKILDTPYEDYSENAAEGI